MPESKPCTSPGPEGRLSRPTASRGARPSRCQPSVAMAWPMARATSGVSWSPTMPRMSYSRKMAAGSCMGGPASATRRGGRRDCRPGVQSVTARPRQVEQAIRAKAEEEQTGNRHRYHGATQPTDMHTRVGLLERLGLHVHRHDHGEIVARRDHARKDENRGERELTGGGGGDEDVPLADESRRPREAEQGQHTDREREREPRPTCPEAREVVDQHVALTVPSL